MTTWEIEAANYADALAIKAYRTSTCGDWILAAEAREVEADAWEELGSIDAATTSRNQAEIYRGYAVHGPVIGGETGNCSPLQDNGRRVIYPRFELVDNPTVVLTDINSRRFSIIDRG